MFSLLWLQVFFLMFLGKGAVAEVVHVHVKQESFQDNPQHDAVTEGNHSAVVKYTLAGHHFGPRFDFQLMEHETEVLKSLHAKGNCPWFFRYIWHEVTATHYRESAGPFF